uniref:Uncharacterized protein n=1 Tax=Palpitomonas bilix TaxID=652834 RepID=A0A7S3GL98_9EUKA
MQTNGYDCGIFVIRMVKTIIANSWWSPNDDRGVSFISLMQSHVGFADKTENCLYERPMSLGRNRIRSIITLLHTRSCKRAVCTVCSEWKSQHEPKKPSARLSSRSSPSSSTLPTPARQLPKLGERAKRGSDDRLQGSTARKKRKAMEGYDDEEEEDEREEIAGAKKREREEKQEKENKEEDRREGFADLPMENSSPVHPPSAASSPVPHSRLAESVDAEESMDISPRPLTLASSSHLDSQDSVEMEEEQSMRKARVEIGENEVEAGDVQVVGERGTEIGSSVKVMVKPMGVQYSTRVSPASQTRRRGDDLSTHRSPEQLRRRVAGRGKKREGSPHQARKTGAVSCSESGSSDENDGFLEVYGTGGGNGSGGYARSAGRGGKRGQERRASDREVDASPGEGGKRDSHEVTAIPKQVKQIDSDEEG